MITQAENKDLLLRISQSDREAFNILVRKYYESLNAFAFRLLRNRETAKDIVQDVFVNLWITRKNIDHEASMKNYLYVATRNLAFNRLRDEKRLDERIVRAAHATEEASSLYIIEEETNRILLEKIAQLPSRSAEVIRLSLDGMKQEQIAAQMNITVSTVKALKKAGIKRLKSVLDPKLISLLMLMLWAAEL
ncbi:sigma-70 family RNA polymerase sigma factor [Alistipes sp. OttesenSCG-928-B03]|nr:sigma-70 family RNA polymerase sigma factor [Alistipes sp. OttesenSCG-928-B03]